MLLPSTTLAEELSFDGKNHVQAGLSQLAL
jgi:hypothetical protein